MKALYAACLVLSFGACSFAAPALDDVSAASSLAESVRPENLMPWVEQLANEHLSDARLSCDGYPPMEMYPSCALTSVAARELVRRTFEQLGFDVRLLRHGAEPDAPVNVEAELPGATRTHEVVLVADGPNIARPTN